MVQKVLSIIVPTYNMEQYLSYCMDSFLIGKNRDKLEVIIVNDGSKDRSLEIAKERATHVPGLFKIIDKENGNYGSCINTALAVATGQYVKVVDADDSVDTQNLDEFITFLQEHDVDLALSDFVLVDEQRVEQKSVSYHFPYTVVPMDEICITERFQEMEMHAVTYRREILLASEYHQTEGVAYTDQQWIFAPMAVVRLVGLFNKPVYRYLVGRNGQTIDPMVKLRRMTERAQMVLGMIEQYEKLSLSVSSAVKSYLDARIFPNVRDIYVTCFSNSSKIDKAVVSQFDRQLKKEATDFYNKLEESNRYIKIWRSIAGNVLLEFVFYKFFELSLKMKLLFKH